MADADLGEIWCRTSRRQSEDAAERLIERIRRRVDGLPADLFAGPQVPGFAEGLRHVVVGDCGVYYRAEEDAVTVLRVLHGRQDRAAALPR